MTPYSIQETETKWGMGALEQVASSFDTQYYAMHNVPKFRNEASIDNGPCMTLFVDTGISQ